MALSLDLFECQNGTPLFRSRISFYEESSSRLETKLKKIVSITKSLSKLMIEQKELTNSLMKEISEFARHDLSHQDDKIDECIKEFTTCLSQVEEHRAMYIEQLHLGLIIPLQTFVEDDLDSLKASKKFYEKSQHELDSSMDKYHQTRYNDFVSLSENANTLLESKRNYFRVSYKYVTDITRINQKKRWALTERIYEYVTSTLSFYQLGFHTLLKLEPFMSTVYSDVKKLKSSFDENCKNEKDLYNKAIEEMEVSTRENYLEFQSKDLQREIEVTSVPSYVYYKKRGYLYQGEKRSHVIFWTRKYFYVIDGSLLEQDGLDPPSLCMSLQLCTVKMATDTDRNFCFYLISPNRTLLLKAEDTKSMKEWISIIQDGIAKGLETETPQDRSRSSKAGETNENLKTLLDEVTKIPENGFCADCGANNPEWASINLGILLCIECSGIHRSLGVQISQVRSLTLDRWRPEWVTQMMSLGNSKSNEKYLENLPKDIEVINPTTVRKEREEWIKRKYVDLEFASEELKKQIKEESKVVPNSTSGTLTAAAVNEEIATGFVVVPSSSSIASLANEDKPISSPASIPVTHSRQSESTEFKPSSPPPSSIFNRVKRSIFERMSKTETHESSPHKSNPHRDGSQEDVNPFSQ